MNILLTGATGFLGRRLLHSLCAKSDFNLTAAVRRSFQFPATNIFAIGDLNARTDWSNVLCDQQVVIHTAARAHIMKHEAAESFVEYQRVNVHGTLNLARHAAGAGVKRFIFISSIGVNGNLNSQPFTEDDAPNPASFYAQSKLEAEVGLWEVQRETGMELVIIRPPLVYGPRAPGNFGNLIRCIGSGVPLPLGAIHNKRSLISIDNLIDLIITCIENPAAANQIFLAADGEDLSTTELLQGVAKAAGISSCLIPVPSSVLMFVAGFLGQKSTAQQILGSLQVDINKARYLLGWKPPLSVEEGLGRCFSENPKRY